MPLVLYPIPYRTVVLKLVISIRNLLAPAIICAGKINVCSAPLPVTEFDVAIKVAAVISKVVPLNDPVYE